MDCPVCPRRDLAEDAGACPNCGTDLGPLRRVRELARAIEGAAALPNTGRQAAWRAGPVTIILALVVSAAAIGFTQGRRGAQPPPANEPPRPVEARDAKPEAPTGKASPIAALDAALRAKQGLALRTSGPGLLIALENGGFASASSVIRAGERQLLEAVAEAVAAAGTGLRVEVRGYTDARPVRRGRRWTNAVLAHARAKAAADVLTRRAAAVPVLIHTAAADGAPFHDPSAGARSRTVVLFVAPATSPLTP